MSYSRAHYRLVSPREDTPAEVEARRRRNGACEQVRAERLLRFPVVTAGNFQEVVDWQERRIRELSTEV